MDNVVRDKSEVPGEVGEAELLDQSSLSRGMRVAGTGRVGLLMVILAVSAGLSTYSVLTGLTPLTPTRELVIGLLALNGILVAGLVGLIAWQLVRLLKARRNRSAGAVLHTRIVLLLSLFAIIPAVIVAIFASVTLNRGLDSWFSERTQSIVGRSVTVAEAYVAEQSNVARLDVAAIANTIDNMRVLFDDDREQFIRRLATLAAFRSIAAAFVIERKKRSVVASVTANNNIKFTPPSLLAFNRADRGELTLLPRGESNVIRAIIKLKKFDDHYLYVYRAISPTVLEQLVKAQAERQEYENLRLQRSGVQLTFAVVYAGVAFIFLLAATWIGIWFADRLVEPVIALVRGARRVSLGDLDTKVAIARGQGDLATLGQTFNQMTAQLKAQREELITTNVQLDRRSRFTEAVLAGVSAGIIGLDQQDRITLFNRSGLLLLGLQEDDVIGTAMGDVLPEIVPVIASAKTKYSGIAEGHFQRRIEAQERSFVVRATKERSSEEGDGLVVTFDDITELVSAQRNSAWADVARRIAHEIKNPLTPIQLSAERIKRKYGKEIVSDRKVFDQCTDTIIRQVGDIGKMVDEFSSFARMPSAQLDEHDLSRVVKEALILQQVSADNISYQIDIAQQPIRAYFDRRLITQAITNLNKNAQEAIEPRLQAEPDPPGKIWVKIVTDRDSAYISVTDNGIGLPNENRSRLTEPYITTREKGTGLGLAIVRRIIEEHGGKLLLRDAPKEFDGGRGAQIELVLPLNLDKVEPDERADTENPENFEVERS